MKTLFKLAIAALVMNATMRYAMVTWDYYQLKDAAQAFIRFAGRTTIEQLRGEIQSKADELGIPLSPQNLTVRREGSRIVAEASYTQPVEYFPRQEYPVDFSFRVDALLLEGGVLEEAPGRRR